MVLIDSFLSFISVNFKIFLMYSSSTYISLKFGKYHSKCLTKPFGLLREKVQPVGVRQYMCSYDANVS